MEWGCEVKMMCGEGRMLVVFFINLEVMIYD